MCCCGSSEAPKPMKFLKYSERSCTDLIPLLLFFAMWASYAAIISTAMTDGANPDYIIYGTDYRGEPCGKTTTGYAAWPKLVPTWKYDFVVCLTDCKLTATDTTMIQTLHNSVAAFNYCIPTSLVSSAGAVSSAPAISSNVSVSSATETASRAIADLYTTWPVILGGCFMALIASMIFVKLMRIECCAAFFVWITILGFVAGGFFGSWSLLYYAYYTPGLTTNTYYMCEGFGWAFFAITLVLLLVVFAMRARINLAISVVSVSAAAIDQTGLGLFLFPIIPFCCFVLFMAGWIAVALVIFSVKTTSTVAMNTTASDSNNFWYGNVDNLLASASAPSGLSSETSFKSYNLNADYQYVFLYHFFTLLYMCQFLLFFTYMVLCHVIAQWYYAKSVDGQGGDEKVVGDAEDQFPESPMYDSCCTICRFHLGSISFAALIIAIIQFIRAIIAYFQAKAKEYKNVACEYFLCCLQCCCGCLETIANYFSKNTLIWTAITGDNFCTAGAEVVSVIASNLLRAGAMIVVTNFMIFLGKLTVTFGVAGLCAFIIEYSYAGKINSVLMPAAIIFINSYVIAKLYLGMFEVAVDTVFMCYLSEGEPHSCAPAKLRDIYAVCDKELAEEEGGVVVEKGNVEMPAA